MTLFDLKHTWEVLFKWAHFISALKVWERPWSYKIHETGTNGKQKFVYSDNSGQNTWNKVKKSSKIGQEQKPLISTSA